MEVRSVREREADVANLLPAIDAIAKVDRKLKNRTRSRARRTARPSMSP